MRVRRVQNRVVDGKRYDRWLVTIPPPLIEELGWTDTTELELKRTKKGLKLEARDR
jgi:bacteriorhodopsin